MAPSLRRPQIGAGPAAARKANAPPRIHTSGVSEPARVLLRRKVPCVRNPRFSRGASAAPEKIQVPLEFQGLAPLAATFRAFWTTTRRAADVAGQEPIVSGMAGRYATAMFELALEQNAVDAVKDDLDRFEALIRDNPDLARLVRSPVFTAEQQGRALDAVLQKAGVGGLAANFLKTVTANRRLFAVGQMITSYRALVARHKGEVTAQVTVAEPLDDRQREALSGALKSVTGKTTGLDVTVDPGIIGGLVVKLGSRMVDSSLRTKLNSIKIAMKEAR
jgi:F-type H+-transporting ATPase subunit delta